MLFAPTVLLSQNNITLAVVLEGAPEGSVFYLKDNDKNLDSSSIKNGKLQFTYSLDGGSLLNSLLVSDKTRTNVYRIWVENKPVIFMGKYGDNTVLSAKGSQTQNDFKVYAEKIQPLEDSLRNMKNKMIALRNPEDPQAITLKNKIQSFRKDINTKELAFIKQHANSSWSAYMVLMETGKKIFSKDESISAFNSLDTDIQNSKLGSDILNMLHFQQDLTIGQPAPVFSGEDGNGKQVNISEYAGKNIVLIFWASWCGPCRAEIPQIRKEYEKRKNGNVTFISVSLDEDPAKWKEALKQEKIDWISLWEPGGWLSKPALTYGVTSLPRMFLIDKKGSLVTKDSNLTTIDAILDR